MNATVRARVLAVVAAALVAAVIAPPAQAVYNTCNRSAAELRCDVRYKAWSTAYGVMKFVINNRTGLVSVDTCGLSWLEGTNTSGRTKVSPLGTRQTNRLRFTLWRACAHAYRPDPRIVCTGWAWQGPR